MTECACAAVSAAVPATLRFSLADGTGIGGNRRDPEKGVTDPEIPVLTAEDAGTGKPIGALLVYSMHPTVLHEDSSVITADFPGAAKKYIKGNLLTPDTPVLYHTGPSGNQSHRNSVAANTFNEAERLGTELARRIAAVWDRRNIVTDCRLSVSSTAGKGCFPAGNPDRGSRFVRCRRNCCPFRKRPGRPAGRIL